MNLILSPHFDDAVLSLGGLLAKEGGDSVVTTFFAGIPEPALVRKWDITCGFTDSTHAVHERRLEDKNALTFLGVVEKNIRTYTHLDAQYRLTTPKGAPVVPEPELETAITQEIVALVQEFAGTPIKLFIPGFGVHTDHLVVKNAALLASKTLPPQSNVEIFFYQEQPYAQHILEKEHPRTMWNICTQKYSTKDDDALLEYKVTGGTFAVSKQLIELTDADIQKKLKGVELYTSQVKNLDTHLLRKIKEYGEVVYTLE